mmetsp:Transcript_83651/g.259922  ORF Transcript_83651/g.259922 Transcript_83651/m.259922 type:complete len:116 (+) Transcript_83651:49-396(+)|eukprot:CAMPEP_0204588588 /NCGR_PEP_ID=MMETSP0661-20131031/48703_1 /ASSEMBLY_ACC=CAM_ASM_000606 /TAXON_ID=109239 /ORGANISM="Alexandrium margalefi, Strain AMGDE01CS-322" /LENGTH=115 /DNA_ID=CAMNT_0051598407 /DNA_START=49 /DNA_END=396 /DNA_ORIENTATION=-
MSRNIWQKTWATKREGWVWTSLNVYFQSAVAQETWEYTGNDYDLDGDTIPTRQVHTRRASSSTGSDKKPKIEEDCEKNPKGEKTEQECEKNPKSDKGEKGDKDETGEKGEEGDTL